MSPATINLILNLAGVLLGGGALAAVLRFKSRMRELRNQDEADIRDHYAQEVAALRAANLELENHFRKLIRDMEDQHSKDRDLWEKRWRASEEDHDTCKRERTRLREELDGIKNQLKMYSADKLLELSSGKPPGEAVVASAERVKTIIENGK